MNRMNKVHKIVEDKHEIARVEAREDAMAALPIIMPNRYGQGIHVRSAVILSGIDFKACKHAKQWESSPNRRAEVTMSWSEVAGRYARAVPKRFELAVWHRDALLCGLALGQPTWSGNKLRLDLIEASPDKTPLAGIVADITIFAAQLYAKTIGATQLRLMKPVNEKVRNHYMNSNFGFSYDKQGNFCYRDL
jgi:hypothetical protein